MRQPVLLLGTYSDGYIPVKLQLKVSTEVVEQELRIREQPRYHIDPCCILVYLHTFERAALVFLHALEQLVADVDAIHRRRIVIPIVQSGSAQQYY